VSGVVAPSGHAGVAAWVAANSADVLAYYPMSDAAASGVLSDESGNNRDGTYGSTITAGTIDGNTVADFPGADGNSVVTVVDAAWMDTIAGVFFVAETDNLDATAPCWVCRSSGGSNLWWISTNGVSSGASNCTTLFTRPSGNICFSSVGFLTNGVEYQIGFGFFGATMNAFLNGDGADGVSGTPSFATGSLGLRFGQIGNGTQKLNGRQGSFVFLSSCDADMFTELTTAWAGA
jgi:hypothetical protein